MQDVRRVKEARKGVRARVVFGLCVLSLLAVLPAVADAQELAAPRLTVSGGYQFMNDPSWSTYLKFGWVAAVTQKLNDRTFVVAEGSGSYGDIPGGPFMVERYAFLGGLKFQPPGDGPRIFVQTLAGLSRQAGDPGIQNGFIAQAGGGVEWVINEKLNGRAFGDYRYLRELGENYHGFRFGGALVFVLWR